MWYCNDSKYDDNGHDDDGGNKLMMITMIIMMNNNLRRPPWQLVEWQWTPLSFSSNQLAFDPGHVSYGRKSADRTEHGNYVIFLVFLATVFGNLEVWKVRKWNIFLKHIIIVGYFSNWTNIWTIVNNGCATWYSISDQCNEHGLLYVLQANLILSPWSGLAGGSPEKDERW